MVFFFFLLENLTHKKTIALLACTRWSSNSRYIIRILTILKCIFFSINQSVWSTIPACIVSIFPIGNNYRRFLSVKSTREFAVARIEFAVGVTPITKNYCSVIVVGWGDLSPDIFAGGGKGIILPLPPPPDTPRIQIVESFKTEKQRN